MAGWRRSASTCPELSGPFVVAREGCSLTGATAPTGRFAPSPTGPLHLGSLITALGAWLSARAAGGRWILRIDDLDPPRCVPGSADDHQRTLEQLGLVWDGPVQFQSTRSERYQAAVDWLVAQDLAFPCACTRRSLGFGPYAGRCANGIPGNQPPRSIRARARLDTVTYDDALQGRQSVQLATVEGDFVVRRADGLFGYHLACVCDDIDFGITEVIRGSDLLAASANQRLLFERFQAPAPRFAHLPTAVDAAENKLSKHTHAPSIALIGADRAMHLALVLLGQRSADSPDHCPARIQLAEALEGWQPARVPRTRHLPVPAWACAVD